MKAAHDKFHKSSCRCYDSIKEQYGTRKDWREIKKYHAISHQLDCKEYEKFYSQMTKGVSFAKMIEMQQNNSQFIKAPIKNLNRSGD